jgi:DNA invertase Pin-like site-specific DNA recombinase
MQIIGYARCSSASQSLDIQLEKLKAAECSRVFSEKRSGREADNRPELQRCLEYVREGDVLVICKLDRMARSLLDLAKISDRLNRKGVALRVLDQAIDTTTAEGRLMFGMLGAFAEFENDLKRIRCSEGVLLAKAKGVKFGRKKALTDDQKVTIRRLHEQEGFSVGQLQSRYQVGRATVYRCLSEASA